MTSLRRPKRFLSPEQKYDLWLRMSRMFPLNRVEGHVSCFRMRPGQLSGDMEKYRAEQAVARRDFLAKFGTAVAIAAMPVTMPRAEDIGLDQRVLLFTLVVSVVSGIAFGLAPAWKTSRSDVGSTLKESGRTLAGGRSRTQGIFVISEMAPPSYSALARLYLTSEMAPMPSPAPVPRNVVTYVTGSSTTITWQSEGTQLGFLIEVSPDFGKSWFLRDLRGDVRTSVLVTDPRATLFRVSAIGPGGLSEPAVSTFGRIDRSRAVRP